MTPPWEKGDAAATATAPRPSRSPSHSHLLVQQGGRRLRMALGVCFTEAAPHPCFAFPAPPPPFVRQIVNLLSRVEALAKYLEAEQAKEEEAESVQPHSGFFRFTKFLTSLVLAGATPVGDFPDPCGLDLSCIIHRVFDNHLPLLGEWVTHARPPAPCPCLAVEYACG